MKITGTYKSKMTAAALSGMLMLGMASPAFATTGEGKTDVDNATQKITDLQEGDTVSAWCIADAYIDSSTNEVKYDMASGLPADYNTIDDIRAIESNSATAKTAADTILAALAGTAATTTATADGSGEATLTLDSGYYLVTVTSTSGKTALYQNILVDASPSGNGVEYSVRTLESIAVKKSNVTAPSKAIVKSGGTGTLEQSDGYSVGDTVTFQITGAIPNYPNNATHATYSVTDTPASGLVINEDAVAVTSGETTLTKDTDYAVTKDGDGKLVIAFKNPIKLASRSYTITYSAQVKAVDSVDGTVANSAHATFNPNPYIDSTVDTGNDPATIKTYGFVFKKVAGDANEALPGAEFQVKDANDNLLTRNGEIVTLTSDENGYVSLAGLAAGTYTLTETKVPAGYQKVKDFKITLSAEDAKADNPATANTTETNYNASTADVVDAEQGLLPATGGAGTVALTAAGVVLVAGATGFIVLSRRRKNDC